MKKQVRSILRRGQRGFTLIELLAVMAILAILVAVVAPSVTGTRDASISARAQQDAKQVTTAAADFYGDQTEAETRTPHTTVVGALSSTGVQQFISSRWPEKFITTSNSLLSLYEVEFEAVSPATKVVLVTLREADNKTAVAASEFLSYTAIDLAGLDTAGYLSQIPDGSDLTTTVAGVIIHNFLWLFDKETSGAGVANDIRTVTVFQLVATDIIEDDNTLHLTYKRILGTAAAPGPTPVPDATAPTVAITSTASSPTSTSPIPVTATFSEPVTGFMLSDITVTNGTKGSFVGASGGTVYTFQVTPAASGTVTVNIAAGVAKDAALNGNTGATFSITFDTTAPTVAITSTASPSTSTSPIPVTATFSEPVTGFTLSDITVTNGTTGSFVAVSGSVYKFEVTPTIASGAVTVDIAAAVALDAASNGNTVATFSIAFNAP